MIFCTVVLSVIQVVALNTGVLPLAKGRALHVVCRFHVAASAELRLDRCHKQIVWSIAKRASINLRKWFLSPTGSIKPWFRTEGNLSMCSSCLPLGVPNWVAKHRQSHFFGAIAGEKEDFCKGSLSLPIFYFVIILLIFFTLFLLASFYQKYKKISSFIVVIFACLLLVLLEWVLLRTPSCVTLLAQTTMILSTILLHHLLLRQNFMRLNQLC
jgi:hypothetical protein